MPVGHEDNYPYPDFARAQASFAPALEIVTGRSTLDRDCKIKTLHTVASFALGMTFPHDHPEVMMSPELEALAKWAAPEKQEGVMGINWKGLLVKLLPLILALLSEDA